MTSQHPITPPPELLEHWENQHYEEGENYDVMLIQAYQAGADQELEECCNYLAKAGLTGDACELALTRRPKPPSLKKQALTMLLHLEDAAQDFMDTTQATTIIRRALETLDD